MTTCAVGYVAQTNLSLRKEEDLDPSQEPDLPQGEPPEPQPAPGELTRLQEAKHAS